MKLNTRVVLKTEIVIGAGKEGIFRGFIGTFSDTREPAYGVELSAAPGEVQPVRLKQIETEA